jgi:transcriptional regulator with XRE-family HTH domain
LSKARKQPGDKVARVPQRKKAADRPTPVEEARSGFSPIGGITKELRRLSGTVIGMASNATDLSLQMAGAAARGPRQIAAVKAAGEWLRKAREAAGLTTRELSHAIDLSDEELLNRAETGRVALPFEVILRLASVLGRHDPLTFALNLTRSFNPRLWKMLEDVGIGRLVVQAGRERELANIYRANDAARKISHEDYEAVLAFVKSAFDMAVQFHAQTKADRARPR